MKKMNQKPAGWLTFWIALAVLGVATLLLVLFSTGPQQGPFLYQIQ